MFHPFPAEQHLLRGHFGARRPEVRLRRQLCHRIDRTPPRLLVLTGKETLTHQLVTSSRTLALHLVARGQEEWIRHFGFQTGREVDKFSSLRWRPGLTGAPVLYEAVGHIEGRVLDSMDCGDHVAHLVEPVAGQLLAPEAIPLTMFEVFTQGLRNPRIDRTVEWTGHRS